MRNRIIVLFFVICFFGCKSHEADLFGCIEGEVRGQKAGGIIINPPPVLTGANVSLLSEGKTLQVSTTKSGGKFEFKNLDPGEYMVAISKAGYIVEHTEPVLVLSEETTSLSIILLEE